MAREVMAGRQVTDAYSVELVTHFPPRSAKMTKSSLYFKQLADLDKSTLEKLLVSSVADLRRRYGKGDIAVTRK